MRRLSVTLGVLAIGASVMSCAAIAGLESYGAPSCGTDCVGAGSDAGKGPSTVPTQDDSSTVENETAAGDDTDAEVTYDANTSGDEPGQEGDDDASGSDGGGSGSGSGGSSGSGSGSGSGGSSGSGSGSGSGGSSGSGSGGSSGSGGGSGSSSGSSGGAKCVSSACTNVCVPYFVQCCKSDQTCGCQLLFPQGACQ